MAVPTASKRAKWHVLSCKWCKLYLFQLIYAIKFFEFYWQKTQCVLLKMQNDLANWHFLLFLIYLNVLGSKVFIEMNLKLNLDMVSVSRYFCWISQRIFLKSLIRILKGLTNWFQNLWLKFAWWLIFIKK